MKRAILLVLGSVLGLMGCWDAAGPTGGGSPTGGSAASFTVFAAASLQPALEQAKADYESANPGTTIEFSFDASATLRTQVEQGDPADLLLSDDTANPERLISAGLASGEPVVFASTVLAVVVPLENPGGIRSTADIAQNGVRIVAANEEEPITTYTSELIGKLAALPDHGPTFADSYRLNVVSREDNVRAVLTKIELSEGDVAVVYGSDATTSTEVTIIDLPPGINVSATYGGVVIGSGTRADSARKFLDWLAGSSGQAILGEFGFAPLS